MTKRIFRTLCLVSFTALAASLILILGVLYDYFSRIQQTQLAMQVQLAAQGVEKLGEAYFDGLDVREYRVTWLDSAGDVLYDSGTPSADLENHLARPEVRQALAEGTGQSRRMSATLTERMLYAAQKLSDGTVLRMAVAQSSIFVMLLGAGQGLAAVILLVLVLALLLSRRLSRRIVEPLGALDLDAPLQNTGCEELEPLLRRLDRQQRQLRAQAEMRRQFTANVSHELKTPLHVISGYAELIENGLARDEDIRPFAGKIRGGVQQMVKLVEDIISLSHLDEGAPATQTEQTDLHAAAAAAAEELASEAEAAGVCLELSGRSAPLSAVPALIRSIAFNLIENGIKYNHPGGHVWIRTVPEDGGAVLTVRDDGPGIPPEQQEHIFERFYRGDESRSKDIPGTGLGLSIVKHAALVLGAEIELDSAPGRGTAVTVRFPASGKTG